MSKILRSKSKFASIAALLLAIMVALVYPASASRQVDKTFQPVPGHPDKLVLLYIGADWCGHCRPVEAAVDRMAEAYDHSLKVIKIDFDEQPELRRRYGLTGVPTLMLFKAGERLEHIPGAIPEADIEAQLLPHLLVTGN